MQIEITEVVLRDGLQDEPVVVSTGDKVQIAEAVMAAGVRSLEVASFVNPKKLPQMADAESFLAALPRPAGVTYSVLSLNPRGVDRAALTAPDIINVVASASNAHSEANAGRTTQQALDGIRESVAAHPGLNIIGSVSTAFTCPFEGLISAQRVVDIVGSLHGIGLRQVGLADTLGNADPEHVARTVMAVQRAFPDMELALHLHDGLHQALQTVNLALELGITRFDSALGGYGGCPYAPGAHGNIATEELVSHLHDRGHTTGIDLDALASARAVLEASLRRAVPVPVS